MESNANQSGLGSLSQSARSKQLKTARIILYAIGILTLLANGVLGFLAEDMVNDAIDAEVAELRRQDYVFDEAELASHRQTAVRSAQLISGVGFAIGVIFVVLGAKVEKYPVPMTITGLVLYIGSNAFFGYLDPESLGRGIIIKVLVIVGLAKAVQAAIAYEKEAKEEEALAEAPFAQ